jgi:fructose-1,6-bisphosphatase/inositol monophosphatase family enzyme
MFMFMLPTRPHVHVANKACCVVTWLLCRCVDPVDGTCNFAHNYPSFCVSVGVLRHALPVSTCHAQQQQ